MTNIDRAAEILEVRHRYDQLRGDGVIGCFDARKATQALADARLLMPDLPEPDNGYPEWLVGGFSISPGLNAGEVDIEWEDREDTGRGTVGRSLYLAPGQVLAILAAADYAERNQA